MIPVLTASESARLDAESSTPVAVLMNRAGLAVARQAVAMGARYGTRVAVLAGPGNNGGDGYAAARHLAARGVDVSVWAVGAPRTEAAADAAAAAASAGVRIRPIGPPRPADLVIDAVFGGRFRRGLPPEVAAWMAAPYRVLAVDIPTGVDPNTGEGGVAFDAEATVTFHTPFPGHFLGSGPDHVGTLVVADIGLEGGDPYLRVTEDVDAPRPQRSRTAHKWSAGSVLVVGGSLGMVGAAVMTARAALSFGAGAVGVASPEPRLVQALAPDVLSYPLEETPDRYDVVVAGPGLGASAADIVERLVSSERPVVFDADALTSLDLASLQRTADRGCRVLTPHAGEFRHLVGAGPWGPDDVRVLAERTGSTVVLKGNPTIVSDGSTPWLVTSNGPELATIGTGDVLAGMVGALIARGLDPVDAARSAAHWHGVAAADLARSGTVTADVLARHVGAFAWSRT